jgi:hypothetical protein
MHGESRLRRYVSVSSDYHSVGFPDNADYSERRRDYSER